MDNSSLCEDLLFFSQHPLLITYSSILPTWISPVFNSETSGLFCQWVRSEVYPPNSVLVPSGRARCFYSNYILFVPGFSLTHMGYFCGCACVGSPLFTTLALSGKVEAMLKAMLKATGVKLVPVLQVLGDSTGVCRCKGSCGSAKGLHRLDALWKEPNLCLPCPFCLLFIKIWGAVSLCGYRDFVSGEDN